MSSLLIHPCAYRTHTTSPFVVKYLAYLSGKQLLIYYMPRLSGRLLIKAGIYPIEKEMEEVECGREGRHWGT